MIIAEINKLPADGTGSMVLGFFAGQLPFIGEILIGILLSIPTFGLSNVVVLISTLIKRIKTLVGEIKTRGFNMDEINFYRNAIISRLNEFKDICKKQKMIIEKCKNKNK